MGGIAFDGVHQIRDQVGALLELHVDLRPAVLYAVLESNEVVVGTDRPSDQRNDNDDNDDNDNGDNQTCTHICSFAGPFSDHSSTHRVKTGDFYGIRLDYVLGVWQKRQKSHGATNTPRSFCRFESVKRQKLRVPLVETRTFCHKEGTLLW